MGQASCVPCPVPAPLDGPPALEAGCPCLSWAGSRGGCSEDQALLPPDLDFIPPSTHSRLPGVEALLCSARLLSLPPGSVQLPSPEKPSPGASATGFLRPPRALWWHVVSMCLYRHPQHRTHACIQPVFLPDF